MERFFNFEGSPAHFDESDDACNENNCGQGTQNNIEHLIKATHDGHEANHQTSHQTSGAKELNPGNPAKVSGQIAHHVLFSLITLVLLS